MRLATLALLLQLALPMSACGGTSAGGSGTGAQFSSVCTGFNHPLAVHWARGSVGDIVEFDGSDGTRARYRLVAIDSPTSPQVLATGSRWTVCHDDRRYRYQSLAAGAPAAARADKAGKEGKAARADEAGQQGGTGFTVDLQHLRGNPDDGPREDFWAHVSVDDARHERWFLFMLDDVALHIRPRGAVETPRHNASRTVGDHVHADVFEVQLDDLSRLREGLPADAAWVSVLMARDVGVVQYTLRDGRVFTRSRSAAQ